MEENLMIFWVVSAFFYTWGLRHSPHSFLLIFILNYRTSRPCTEIPYLSHNVRITMQRHKQRFCNFFMIGTLQLVHFNNILYLWSGTNNMLMLIISEMLNDDFKNEKRKVLRVIRKVWLTHFNYSEEILSTLHWKKENEIVLPHREIQMGSVI